MEQVSLSIIMPALNEEKNILAAVNNSLEAFKEFCIDGEVVVINDGSTDRTMDIVGEVSEGNDRVRIIKHETPQGIGASFWDGVDNAKGESVCMMPGDNENDPWEIMRYYKLLEHVDIIIPFVFNKQVRSLFRNSLSLIYRFIINSTFLVYFNYTNGTVLYRKSILEELDYRSGSFFFQTDILIRTVKKGYLFAEVPYSLGERNHGVSKAVSFPSLLQVIKGYFRLTRDIYSKSGNIRRRFTKDSLAAQRHDRLDGYPGKNLH